MRTACVSTGATLRPIPVPLSVALVIDQTVTHDTMNKINASLAALQGAFASYDEVAVFTYNNGAKDTDDLYRSAEQPADGSAGALEGQGARADV